MIETPRLLLRPFRPADLGAVTALLADPEVMRYSVTGAKPADDIAEDLEDWVRTHRPGRPERWSVTVKAVDEPIGFCGFSYHPVNGEFVWELGYRFQASVWGRGIATEAATACRDWFFATRPESKFVLMIDPANVASARVAEKIGARYEFDSVCYEVPVGIYVCRRA